MALDSDIEAIKMRLAFAFQTLLGDRAITSRSIFIEDSAEGGVEFGMMGRYGGFPQSFRQEFEDMFNELKKPGQPGIQFLMNNDDDYQKKPFHFEGTFDQFVNCMDWAGFTDRFDTAVAELRKGRGAAL